MSQRSTKSRAAVAETAALKRAAKAALNLAQQTGTACYVEVDGKIVDIANSEPSASQGSAGASTAKKRRPPAKRK